MDRYKLLNLISNATIFVLFLITAFFIFARSSMETFDNFYSIIFLILNLFQVSMFVIIVLMFIIFEKGTKVYHAMAKSAISFFVYFVLGVLIFTSLAIR